MAKTLSGENAVLTTSVTDIYTASSNTMTLLIQGVNINAGQVNFGLWMVDDNNNYMYCVFPTQSLDTMEGLTDTNKHLMQEGYTLQGIADNTNSIYVEITAFEGW